MTPRYNHETTNGNNDMFIRRFRLKGSGSAYGVAKYGAEIKIDNTGRFEVSPVAIVENAWLDFPVVEDEAYVRAGRFDTPFSRNELTSDSKLLLMDRTLIKEAVTAVGMADKQYGVMLHGRPDCGRWEYDLGIFDSNVYEKTSVADTRETDQLMPAARVTYSFLDRPTARWLRRLLGILHRKGPAVGCRIQHRLSRRYHRWPASVRSNRSRHGRVFQYRTLHVSG